jgi:RNA-binding protein
MSSTLTSKQKADLAAMAHNKKPIVFVGQKGVTEAVTTEMDQALLAHELVKVRIRGSENPEGDAQEIADTTGADLVDMRGGVALYYRPHPIKPRIKI